MKTPFTLPSTLYRRQLTGLVQRALAEDIGNGDATVASLQLGQKRASAAIVAKSTGVLAGVDAVKTTMRALDRGARVEWKIHEGQRVKSGQTVARISAHPAALLSGERTALNFLSHLSGIATATRQLSDRLRGTGTRLLDTRKTTPAWRYLEKYAAGVGGAVNHRLGLHDALMIKSNHVVAVGDFEETVRRAVKRTGRKVLVCEVRTMAEINIALGHNVSWLLLDHFRGARLRQAIQIIRAHDKKLTRRGRSQTIIEVSGNINARSIAAVARYGPDFVSSGAITHSAQAIDFSMTWS